MGPPRRVPHLLLVSWSFLFAMRGAMLESSIWERCEYRYGPLENICKVWGVEGSTEPPAGPGCCHPGCGIHSAFNLSSESSAFHFSSCSKVCIQQLSAFGTQICTQLKPPQMQSVLLSSNQPHFEVELSGKI
jgi:hypothetical protein